MNGSTHVWLSVLGMVLLAQPLAARSVDETRAASAEPSVRVENLAGSVVVKSWDRQELHITGELGSGVEQLRFEGGPDNFQISVELPRRSRGLRNSEAHLEITLPRRSELRVGTVSANIDISGVEGRLEAESVSGDLKISGGGKEVEAQTVSGDLWLERVEGRIEVASVSGEVQLREVGGEIDAGTVSGELLIEAAQVSRVELESVSGEIEFNGSPSPGARLSIESHSGDVTLRLPRELAAELRMSTFSGKLRNQLGETAEQAERADELKLSLGGGGGARLHVSTFSGDVELLPR